MGLVCAGPLSWAFVRIENGSRHKGPLDKILIFQNLFFKKITCDLMVAALQVRLHMGSVIPIEIKSKKNENLKTFFKNKK
jgi:hypothetical protein